MPMFQNRLLFGFRAETEQIKI